MSLIDKQNLNYFTTVEQFFISLKDSGLALSANDYNLIAEWESRGIPVDVVCRAIEKGYVEARRQSRRAQEQKISLFHLKETVENEIKMREKR